MPLEKVYKLYSSITSAYTSIFDISMIGFAQYNEGI